jgi:hypothetical protein
MPRRAATMT